MSMKKLAMAVVLAMSIGCTAAFAIAKGKISVLSREEGSGTRGAFIELFGVEQKDANGKKADMTTDDADITNNTAVMMTMVAENPSPSTTFPWARSKELTSKPCRSTVPRRLPKTSERANTRSPVCSTSPSKSSRTDVSELHFEQSGTGSRREEQLYRRKRRRRKIRRHACQRQGNCRWLV